MKREKAFQNDRHIGNDGADGRVDMCKVFHASRQVRTSGLCLVEAKKGGLQGKEWLGGEEKAWLKQD